MRFPSASSLRRWPWLQIALLAMILTALVVLARQNGDPQGVLIQAREPAPGIDQIRVDVSGAVRQPSVVVVQPGERVIDAIALAGGLRDDADRSAINLSRRLVDQDHIVVPARGEHAPLLNVNTASAAELEALPGIGPVYASRVIKARNSGGAFRSTDELVERAALPARVYEQVRDLIVAR